jgi:hypothetical protein
MNLTSHSKGQNIILGCDAFLKNSRIKDLPPVLVLGDQGRVAAGAVVDDKFDLDLVLDGLVYAF